mmetsp:Transcript_27919/g.61280  ORF Transcript_27919/g.61280 Transcript_27919/m.61280 type:complete len:270 (-) Transcript_27919:277-1086(-)
MDLAIAAAAVGNQTDAELIAALASASGAGGNDESMYADPIDLPCVSDLEVAAAAAAAALEVLAPGSSSEEEGSSDDDDSSDSDEDSSSAGDSMSTDQDGDVHMADAARAVRHVALELVPGPQGLTATLRVLQQHTGTGGPARAAGTVPAAAQGREVETDSSDGSSSSSSSSSSTSSAAAGAASKGSHHSSSSGRSAAGAVPSVSGAMNAEAGPLNANNVVSRGSAGLITNGSMSLTSPTSSRWLPLDALSDNSIDEAAVLLTRSGAAGA